MIIPIRCMNCGNVIADKWRLFQERVKVHRAGTKETSTVYIDGTTNVETAEKKALDELGFRRWCCRKHFLTHVDLLDKL